MRDTVDTVALRLLKASDAEQRISFGVAYPAMKADAAVAQDGHRDFIRPEQLERAAHQFLAEHREIGLHHADGTSGSGVVVESAIHRGKAYKTTAIDGSEVKVEPGDWVLAVRWSPEAWKLIKSGQVRGYSPQGMAQRRKPSKSDIVKLRERAERHGRKR